MEALKTKYDRGFKAEAERKSVHYRTALKIHPCNPLPGEQLAEYLNVKLLRMSDLVKMDPAIGCIQNSFKFSGLRMKDKAGNDVVIYNDTHSDGRCQSNIMHELAHVICKHSMLGEFDSCTNLPFGLRYFNEKQELEAKFLGAALQISKPGLLFARKNKLSVEEVAARFNSTTDMVTYRLRMTGLNRRF